MSRKLFLIPARRGSKGLPGKNVKLLGGKPLIQYSIEFARLVSDDADICVSTNDSEAISIAKRLCLAVPFVRPDVLATDTANSREVILHAVKFFEEQKIYYDEVVLLQPTSPFRKKEHLVDMVNLFNRDIDMVVSVSDTNFNPYFSLFEEDELGFLAISKPSSFTRRQDSPKVYKYNGSIYLINVESLKKCPIGNFAKVVKYEMNEVNSIDIDTQFDWWIAEMIIERSLWTTY